MFDLTSSKLLLLAVVALLVIGPKDFPVLLRTIGKYMGIIRGHAREFRAQFDEAMREAELSQLKKDMENIAREAEASIQSTTREVEQTLNEAGRSVADAGRTIETSIESPSAPAAQPQTAAESAPPVDGAPPADNAPAAASSPAPAPSEAAEPPNGHPVAAPAPEQVASEPARVAERTGA